MLTSELDYRLPDDLIAHRPASPRDSSRLMVVDARNQTIEHYTFRDLPLFLRAGDALVLNETKVLPARLYAHRPNGGETELLFLREVGLRDAPGEGLWEVMARPSRRLKAGMALSASGEELRVLKPLDP